MDGCERKMEGAQQRREDRVEGKGKRKRSPQVGRESCGPTRTGETRGLTSPGQYTVRRSNEAGGQREAVGKTYNSLTVKTVRRR